MKKPVFEVVRLNGYDSMATYSCSSNEECPKDAYCTRNCNPVQGYCTECMDDCIPLD